MRPKLVLDMDETLLHAEWVSDAAVRVYQRPGVEKFLMDMSEVYDLVLYTAGTRPYAENVMKSVDPSNLVGQHLYRESCVTRSDGTFMKDLNRVPSVELSRTLILDDTPENFSEQPMNVIPMRKFYDDPSDDVLQTITPFLLEYACTDMDARQFTKLMLPYFESLL